MGQPEVKLLEQHLGRWTRQRRLQRALTWGWRGLLIGGTTSLLISIALVLQESIVASDLVAIVVAASILMALIGGFFAYLWRFSPSQAARYFDQQLELKERVSTALELSAITDNIQNELIDKQHRSALEAASQIDISKQRPLHLKWREVSLIFLLIGGVVATLFYGAPLFARATATRGVQTAIEEEIARIEEIQANIEADQSLTEAQQSALTEPLNTALEQLEDAKSLEDALATLGEAQQELQSLADPGLAEQLEGLQAAGQELAQGDTNAPLNQFGESLAQSELEQAAQDLAAIDPNDLTLPELGDLGEQLSEAAEALADSNPELAEELAQAAEALESGDLEAMRDALGDAVETLEGTGEEVTLAEIAGEGAEELGEGQEAIAQVGGLSELLGQAQSGNLIEGPGSGSAGNGEFTEPLDAGSEVALSKIDQENLPGDGGEIVYEPIYAPENLGGDDALGGGLPESDAEGETLGTTASDPLEDGNTSTVPYIEVLAEYEDIYRAALENDEVPLEWRNVIREYFSSLQP